MIRLFNVYYPIRTLILLAGEALIVWSSFLLGTMLQFREDSYLVLNFEYGYYKILMVTAVVLLFSHWFDLYDPSSFNAKWEQVFRLLLVLGLVLNNQADFAKSYVNRVWSYLTGVVPGWAPACPISDRFDPTSAREQPSIQQPAD